MDTVFRKDRELFDDEVFSFDRFCWAIGVVRSQLHPPLDKDQISLLPIVVNVSLAFFDFFHQFVVFYLDWTL